MTRRSMSGSAGRPRLAGPFGSDPAAVSVPTAPSLSRVRNQHGLDGRAAGSVRFGLVDLAERVAGDELVEREPALLPQVEKPRDEQLRHSVAFHDAHQVAAAGQSEWVQDEVARGDADEPAGTGGAEAADGGADHGRDPGGVEAVLSAIAGDGEDLGGEVVVGAVEGVGGAEIGGQIQAAGLQVDGDDRGGSGDGSGHHGGQPDAARPEDGDAGSGSDAERDEHRSGPGLDPAAERSEEFQPQTRGQPDGLAYRFERAAS